MLSFLNKPYPHTRDAQKNLLASLLIGVFVAFFLVVFQPFGISQWEDESKFIKLVGYGLVSCLIPIILNGLFAIFPAKQIEDNWRVWMEISNIALVVLCIAAGNVIYTEFIGLGNITWRSYLDFIAITFAIGIFPIAFGVIRRHNRFLKLNAQTATEINIILNKNPVVGSAASEQIKRVVFVAENEKDRFEVEPHQLLYIASADNYSELFYLAEGKAQKTLLRGSLKRWEEQLLPFPYLVRCHRTFIVNLENVKHMEGNAAGYKLTISNSASTIPVSRNYTGIVAQKLKRIRQ
jgi:hypothetical protein